MKPFWWITGILGGSLAVSLASAYFFGWKFAEVIAMVAVCLILTTIALLVYARTGSKMNVGWVFLGGFVLYLAMYTGWSWNFTPTSYVFKACPEFYSIVQQPQPNEGGCTKQDFENLLLGTERYVANQNYGPTMYKELEEDIEELWRIEREGGFSPAPFPRFKQAWGEYQAALVNEAADRLTGNPEQQRKSWAYLYAVIFLGFLINGILSFFKLRVIGGVQFLVGLVAALGAWIAWVNPENFRPFFPADVSPEVLLIMENYWNIGFMLGILPQLLPAFGTVADFFKGELKVKLLFIVVPAIFLAFGMFFSPNLVLIMMTPGINEVILEHPEISITPIQLAIEYGLLAGLGGVSLFQGVMNLFTGR